MMKKKFGILLTTRNTYTMIDEWYSLYDYTGVPILNLDLNSEKKYRAAGQEICKKYGIDFLDANTTALQDNILQAAQFFFEKKGIEWVLYMHHDAYPMEKNSLYNLDELLSNSKKMKKFGVIGFNVYHDQYDLKQFKKGHSKLMTTARTPLELGNGYYSRKISSRVNYNNFLNKPYAVESVFWSTVLINYFQYKKNIKIDFDFNFFNSWDDVAFQFLQKNIYNIVIPDISFAHDQSLKLKHNLPRSSPNGNPKLYGRTDHLKCWKNKWGFYYSASKYLFGGDYLLNRTGFINKCIDKFSEIIHYDLTSSLQTIARRSYKKHLESFPIKRRSLIDDFYNHDPKNGPLKYFDL
jgi:hypothetical protein